MKLREGNVRTRAEAVAAIEEVGYWPSTRCNRAGTVIEEHWHAIDELVFVLEGEIEFADPETGDLLVLREGDCLVLPADTHHRVTAIADVVYITALERPLPDAELTTWAKTS